MRLPKSSLIGLCCLLIALLALHINWWILTPPEELLNEDIFYAWKEGTFIADGINPYARILLGNFRENQKYPTYLPLVYILSALLQKIGITEFSDFLSFWRPICFISHASIGLSIFYVFWEKGYSSLGLVATTIIFLGRWSNYIIKVQHLEFLAISCLTIGLLLIKKNRFYSGLLIGISLCTKHLAVLIIPIVIMSILPEKSCEDENNLFKSLVNFLYGLLTPVAVMSLPFLFNNPSGFLFTLAFPVSRLASDHGIGTGLSSPILGTDGIKVILYMIILFIYYIQLKSRIRLYSISFLILTVFTQFNSIVFTQYYFWLVCFGLLALSEMLERRSLPDS